MMPPSPSEDRRSSELPLDALLRFEQAVECRRKAETEAKEEYEEQSNLARRDKEKEIERLSFERNQRDQKSQAEHDRQLRAAEDAVRAQIKIEIQRERQILDKKLASVEGLMRLAELRGPMQLLSAKKEPRRDALLTPDRALELASRDLEMQITSFISFCERYQKAKKRVSAMRIAALVAVLIILLIVVLLVLT